MIRSILLALRPIGLLAGIAYVGLSGTHNALAVTRYDAVKQFSTKSNPAGVWGYLDAHLLAYRHTHYDGVKGVEGWSDDLPHDSTVTVRKNTTGHAVVLDGGKLIIPTDQLMLDDEANIDGATVLFTAPTAGTYHVRGSFTSLASDGAAHTVYVSLNSNGIFGKRISHGHRRSFRLTVTMAVGDKLQFTSDRQSKEQPTQTGLAVKIAGP